MHSVLLKIKYTVTFRVLIVDGCFVWLQLDLTVYFIIDLDCDWHLMDSFELQYILDNQKIEKKSVKKVVDAVLKESLVKHLIGVTS